MRLFLFAAASAVLMAMSASSVDADNGPILPGYWESTSKVSFPIPSSKTDRKCISARAINAYLTGPSNPHYTCRYDTRHLEGGHAQMEGECVDNNGLRSKIKIDGVYAPESFTLNGHLQVQLGGLGIPVSTSIDAHRLSGECPVGMKVEDGNPPKAGEEHAGD
jgi:hypothetical protein